MTLSSKIQPFFSALLLVWLLHHTACSYSGNVDNAAYKSAEPITPATYQDESAGSTDVASDESGGAALTVNGNPTAEPTPTKIIKTANVKLQVKNYTQALQTVKQLAASQQATVSGENEYNSHYRLENSMTIRVPAQRFDTLVNQLLTVAVYVENKQISSEDVGEQYVDIEARMNAKKQVEARYLELLKKAGKIEEILAVERQLGQIREEIEAAQGKLKYFDNRVQFSTINLTLYQQLDYTAPNPERSFWGRLKEAFFNGWSGLLEFFVVLINLWPFLIIGGALFLLLRKWRNNRKNSQSTKN